MGSTQEVCHQIADSCVCPGRAGPQASQKNFLGGKDRTSAGSLFYPHRGREPHLSGSIPAPTFSYRRSYAPSHLGRKPFTAGVA
jgi:hypothetical protein